MPANNDNWMIVPTLQTVLILRLIAAGCNKGPKLGHRQRVATYPVIIGDIDLMRWFFVGIFLAAHPERPGWDKAKLHPVNRCYWFTRIAEPGQGIAGAGPDYCR
jgi:hypothetical protein